MIIIVRKVIKSSVLVDSIEVSQIGQGVLLYIGFENSDTPDQCLEAVEKIVKLRIFDDSCSKNIIDFGGEILSVSQFTLLADTKKGTRPSFSKAMKAQEASILFKEFNSILEQKSGIKVQTGVFGADMKVSAIDDGPFTLILHF